MLYDDDVSLVIYDVACTDGMKLKTKHYFVIEEPISYFGSE